MIDGYFDDLEAAVAVLTTDGKQGRVASSTGRNGGREGGRDGDSGDSVGSGRSVHDAAYERAMRAGALKDASELIVQLRIDISAVADEAKRDAYMQRLKTAETVVAAASVRYRADAFPTLGRRDPPASVVEKSNPQTRAAEMPRADVGLQVLESARSQLHETEAVGAATLQDLRSQRDTVQHAHANAKRINHNLAKGQSLLSQMARWWRG